VTVARWKYGETHAVVSIEAGKGNKEEIVTLACHIGMPYYRRHLTITDLPYTQATCAECRKSLGLDNGNGNGVSYN
jgi:hypothetical protein